MINWMVINQEFNSELYKVEHLSTVKIRDEVALDVKAIAEELYPSSENIDQ